MIMKKKLEKSWCSRNIAKWGALNSRFLLFRKLIRGLCAIEGRGEEVLYHSLSLASFLSMLSHLSPFPGHPKGQFLKIHCSSTCMWIMFLYLLHLFAKGMQGDNFIWGKKKKKSIYNCKYMYIVVGKQQHSVESKKLGVDPPSTPRNILQWTH